MAAANTITTLNGFHKQVYAPRVQELVPASNWIQKNIPFSEGTKIGKQYEMPVNLALEGGFTHAATGDGAFSLNDSIAMTLQPALIDGYQIMLRSQLDYEAAAKAANGDAKSFGLATKYLVGNMIRSMSKRMEIEFLYGQSGLGVIDSVNPSGGTAAIVLTEASFADAIFAGSTNYQFDVWNNADSGTSTQRNTNAAVVLASFDPDTRTLNVTGNSTDMSALAPGDIIFYRGAKSGTSPNVVYKEMAGINKILSTTSGSIFGISVSTYDLWRAIIQTAGSAQLTIGKVLIGSQKAVARGLDDETVLLVNPLTWANLASDLAALRYFDGSYKIEKGSNGVVAIEYYSQAGAIKIISHRFVKRGEAFQFPQKYAERIGAIDMSFTLPGANGSVPDQYWFPLQNNAGYELRLYSNQAIFHEMPATCIKYNNINNLQPA
ncbi:MAG TPA: hypothetical protein PLM85_09560 [Nitrosomonas sp.]|nr:hypothetical protein [Nitrosomonas sp.]HNJ38552.1 hypothetical protein [Nitrosomonas sp.]